MALIVKPNTFSSGATIYASEHNANFNVIYIDYNGNITNDNIAATAAIADSKLGQIVTASKVNGSALTGLASVPSSAGIIPIINLGSGTTSNTVYLRGDGTFATPPGSASGSGTAPGSDTWVPFNNGGTTFAASGSFNYNVATNVLTVGSLITTTTTGVAGYIRLKEDPTNGANYVGLKAPNSIAANLLWTLPAADGTSGNSIFTDGQTSLIFGQSTQPTSTPKFGKLGLGTVAISSAALASSGQYFSMKAIDTVTAANAWTSDWANSNVHYIVLGNAAHSNLTLANPQDGARYMMILKQPAAGTTATVTFPTTMLFPGGAATTLSVTNSKVDIVTLVYDATNTQYYCGQSLNY